MSSTDFPIKFAERLKTARKERGLNQTDLGQMVGRSQGTVAAWEKGANETDIEMLWRIADALDVTLDYLIGRSDKMSRAQADVITGVTTLSTKDLEAILRARAEQSEALKGGATGQPELSPEEAARRTAAEVGERILRQPTPRTVP